MLRCSHTFSHLVRGSPMATKARPYERFGSYLLFRNLETDSISELWRAAEIVNGKLGDTVVLRRFTAGDRTEFRAAAEHARSVVVALTGTTVAKGQKLGFVDGVPYLVHEYIGGRSLRTIVDRARGANGAGANPIPLDQALAITEKLASSCEMLTSVKYQGTRLVHGALIPQFVWISDEGEVRTAGQQFWRGLVASLKQATASRELGGYFAPEIRAGGQPSKASDVWSLGAILYLNLTGHDFMDSTDAAAVRMAVENAQLAGRQEAVPADIKPILVQSLCVDPAGRYPSAAEMRQALDKLLNGGEYAPTTFNLAFYLHSLLKKEMESDAGERASEAEVDLNDYPLVAAASAPAAAPLTAPKPVERSAAEANVSTPFASSMLPPAKKSRMPFAVAAGAIVAIGAGAFVVLGTKVKTPPVTAASAAAALPKPTAAPAAVPIEPIVAAVPGADPAAAATLDPDARKKMIDDAVNKRLQEEMMKLQEQYNKQLETKTTASRPASPAAPAPQREEAPSAAQLDQQRRAAAQAEQRRLAETPAAAPSLPTTPTSSAAAEPAPAVAAAPQVREGDLVAINELDGVPELRVPVRPTYPPLAAKQRKEATIIVSALISESGRVTDVKILRGDTARMGFDEAAVRAVRQASFSAPMKDGKRVKTWKPLPIVFKLQ